MKDSNPENLARKVTAADVAKLAGVSRWTVSRALTDGASIAPESRERVIQAARELGYRPNLLARSLSQKRSNMVALVVDEMQNPYMLRILEMTMSRLQQKGLMSLVLNISRESDFASALTRADQFQADGVLFLGTVLPDRLIHMVENMGHIPLIVMYRDSDVDDVQIVATDGFSGTRQLTALLQQQGCQRFAYMSGPGSVSTRLGRKEGFTDALTSQQQPHAVYLQASHFSRQQGYDVTRLYLNNTRADQYVDALVCENDILAIGAIDALREQGLEGHIAVTGFDDLDLAASPSYQLTTCSQPDANLIDEAIKRLLSPDQEHRRIQMPPQLVIRGSHIRIPNAT